MSRQKGFHHPKETKEKMSVAKQGLKFSEEHRAKLSAAHKKYWETHTLSEAERKRRGKLISEAQRKKHLLKKKRTLSEETRRKMSEARKAWAKAHPLTQEQREKLAESIANGWHKKKLKVLQSDEALRLPVSESDLQRMVLRPVDVKAYVKRFGKINLF